MATVCANCGTTAGPFVRDADTPSKPICGFRPSHRANVEDKAKRTAECSARRQARDNAGMPTAA